MEVLKHGKWYRIVTCDKCECEFQFNVKETKTKFMEEFGYFTNYTYIECPECDHRIILEERSVET